MFLKFLKLVLTIFISYQTPLYSKSATFNDFNSRDLSNYFSGIVAFENQDNSEALKFFNLAKVLINKHDKTWISSLWDLDSGFWTFPAGSGEEVSRRIRMLGQIVRIPASGGQKSGKRAPKLYFQFVFPSFLFLC